MSKICLFYATKGDLLAFTKEAESLASIKYVRYGTVSKLPPESFASAADIPNLGTASNPSAGNCQRFLVANSMAAIEPRRLRTLKASDVIRPSVAIGNKQIVLNKQPLRELVGQSRFAIDQFLNPDTITFTPAGEWNNEILLHGSIGTASPSKSSHLLMRKFQTALEKTCVKLKAYYVGPQALALLRNGTRLTISAQSPREFDLTLET